MSITHISDREQALERENERLLHTVRIQSEALELINGTVEEMRVYATRYQQIRRGQKWSVIDGIGNTLRAEQLDAAIDNTIKESK